MKQGNHYLILSYNEKIFFLLNLGIKLAINNQENSNNIFNNKNNWKIDIYINKEISSLIFGVREVIKEYKFIS